MFCKDCGAQLADDARFCTNCGSTQAVTPPADFCAGAGDSVANDCKQRF